MTWDYVIIGAGSAGCALVAQLLRLSPGSSILLLEAGGRDNSPSIKLPMWQPRASATFDWGYRSEPDPTRNGAQENWKRGRVLGGSSSINGMVYVRGAAEDFDRWNAELGNYGGWSASDVFPIFAELEVGHVPMSERRAAGRIHVSTVKHPHPVTKMFVESAVEAGHRFNPDYNGNAQEGVSYLKRSVRRGFRCSASDAFLKPNLRRHELSLETNVLVERVRIENGRATGVYYRHDGMEKVVGAKQVVLCAGAINSPKILMHSGVGDKRELEKHGIRVVHRLPGVGKNLIEHPLVRMIFRANRTTYNLTAGISQKLAIAAKFFALGEGPISGVYESALFFRSSPEQQYADLQLYFAPIGYLGKMGGKGELTPYPAFMLCLAKSRPLSRGQIRLRSADPADKPLIECRLLENDRDVETLARGIAVVRRIVEAPPLADVTVSEIVPGPEASDHDRLAQYVRDNTEPMFHPVGTCKMGIDEDAVVSPDLAVRGLRNLWVADASIMPSHISANINAACMMIGAKLGRQLASRGDRPASD